MTGACAEGGGAPVLAGQSQRYCHFHYDHFPAIIPSVTASELVQLLAGLPPDANIDVLHVVKTGPPRAFSVVNISEDALGSHIIVESKRKLAEDAVPNCKLCGKRLANPKTRRPINDDYYCHPAMMLRTCWDKAAEV